jgi:hypothetical protein
MAEQMEVPFPHCPHCDAELPAPSLFSWQHMGWVILCVFCPNPGCLKTCRSRPRKLQAHR